jgi:hypothetical protein
VNDRLEDDNPIEPGHRRRISREGMWLMILIIASTLTGPAAVALWYFTTHSEAEIKSELGGKD